MRGTSRDRDAHSRQVTRGPGRSQTAGRGGGGGGGADPGTPVPRRNQSPSPASPPASHGPRPLPRPLSGRRHPTPQALCGPGAAGTQKPRPHGTKRRLHRTQCWSAEPSRGAQCREGPSAARPDAFGGHESNGAPLPVRPRVPPSALPAGMQGEGGRPCSLRSHACIFSAVIKSGAGAAGPSGC